MSNLYMDSNDCTNSSHNILAVYTTPKNCFDRKTPNTAKGSLLVQNKGVHCSVFIMCARVHHSSVLMFALGLPESFATVMRAG